jgi:hypothetical protein
MRPTDQTEAGFNMPAFAGLWFLQPKSENNDEQTSD